jgi:hypothetical protein
MTHLQVKEVVQAECAVCHHTRDVNFYSLSVCNHCHECPECGTAANDCFKTVPYFCLAAEERRARIVCTKCGASWTSRLKLDRAVIYKNHTGPSKICKVCGKDVWHAPTSPFGLAQRGPCVCRECLDCPSCRTGGVFSEIEHDGKVVCAICGKEWSSLGELEDAICQLSE